MKMMNQGFAVLANNLHLFNESQRVTNEGKNMLKLCSEREIFCLVTECYYMTQAAHGSLNKGPENGQTQIWV
jgi:hypothetical protein